jgi:hypothetical protein
MDNLLLVAFAGLCLAFILSWTTGYRARPTRYQLRYGQVDPLFWIATIVNTLSFLGLLGLFGYAIWRLF